MDKKKYYLFIAAEVCVLIQLDVKHLGLLIADSNRKRWQKWMYMRIVVLELHVAVNATVFIQWTGFVLMCKYRDPSPSAFMQPFILFVLFNLQF